jgi:hypothetical protein
MKKKSILYRNQSNKRNVKPKSGESNEEIEGAQRNKNLLIRFKMHLAVKMFKNSAKIFDLNAIEKVLLLFKLFFSLVTTSFFVVVS